LSIQMTKRARARASRLVGGSGCTFFFPFSSSSSSPFSPPSSLLRSLVDDRRTVLDMGACLSLALNDSRNWCAHIPQGTHNPRGREPSCRSCRARSLSTAIKLPTSISPPDPAAPPASSVDDFVDRRWRRGMALKEFRLVTYGVIETCSPTSETLSETRLSLSLSFSRSLACSFSLFSSHEQIQQTSPSPI